MKFILPLLFAFLVPCFAQENRSSIIVEDYVAFLSSTPGAGEHYDDANMHSQIERLQKGDEIIFCAVEGQEKQEILRLTDLDMTCYWHWKKNSTGTTSPLFFRPPSDSENSSPEHSSAEDSDSESEQEKPLKEEEQNRLRAVSNGISNCSSQQQRSSFTRLEESVPSHHNSPPSFSPNFYTSQQLSPANVPAPHNLQLDLEKRKEQLPPFYTPTSSYQRIELSCIKQDPEIKENFISNEQTPLLNQGQRVPAYSNEMDRTSSAQEEIARQGCFSKMPSNSELACLAFACAQPALLAYTGGMIHAPTMAAFARGYATTALAEYGAIGISIVTPIAGSHLYDALHPRMASCIEVASRPFLNF